MANNTDTNKADKPHHSDGPFFAPVKQIGDWCIMKRQDTSYCIKNDKTGQEFGTYFTQADAEKELQAIIASRLGK
ncbi:MAG: hypothetical protein Q4E49_03635 [Bacteroidales bacterium]|nr:hypothetical protein [Bacteroidales bacterium]